MARKRRDNKRDPSTGQRIAKLGKAALTVGAGAALLSKTNYLKHADEFTSAVTRSVKGFSDDLLGKKHTAINIHDSFRKNIGFKGEGIKENLIRKRREKISVDEVSKRSLLGRMNSHNDIAGIVYQATKEDMYQSAALEAAKEMADKYKDKYKKPVIEKIVNNAMAKRESIALDGEIDTKFIEATMDAHNMSKEDAEDIIKETLKHAKKIDNNARLKGELGRRKEIIKELEQKDLENIKRNTRENLWLNKIGKKIGIDDLEGKLLGSRAATWSEIEKYADQLDIENTEQLAKIKKKYPTAKDAEPDLKDTKINPWAQIKEANRDHSFDNVIFDDRIRIRTNEDGSVELFSVAESIRYKDQFMGKWNSSLPGKILTKGIDLKGINDAPNVAFFVKGKKSFTSGYGESDGTTALENFFYVDGKLFKEENINGTYHLSEEGIEGFINSHAHGTLSGIQKAILGDDLNGLQPLSSTNKWFQRLDINQDGSANFIKRYKEFFTKHNNPNWERNRINRVQDRILSGRTIEEEISHTMNSFNVNRIEAINIIKEDNDLMNDLFRNRAASNAISDDTLAIFKQSILEIDAKTDEAKAHVQKALDLLDLLIEGNENKTFKYLTENQDIVFGASLNDLIKRYKINAQKTLNSVSIESSTTKKIPILDIELPETNVGDINAILRTEMIKEVADDNYIWNSVIQNLGNNLEPQQQKNLVELYQWVKFENATAMEKNLTKNSLAYFTEGSPLDVYLGQLRDSPNMRGNLVYTLEEFKEPFGVLHKGNLDNPNEMHYSNFNEFEFTKKTTIGKELIQNLNDATKWKAAFRELNAGRKNPEDVSIVTLGLEYMLKRLSDGVADAGLGLSSKSMSSPLATAMNIMTRRVLPAFVAYTAFDYLNDMSQDIMGVGITGAAANSVKNLDLLGRSIAYHTGVGQALDWLKQTSVIGEYWTGSTDYQTKEERQEWYMNGYSPVRKSRYWSFGSASEYRGGDITYFEPNYWRRALSDYHDKWLYGSNWEKWKHSIVPTPTHPFSTIRYLMNPYWLEEKHIDDAPTPLTGKMFSEGTPWGAILNPTIGEAIKPVGMLPEVRRRLTGKGHDSKAIVQRINERIKNKKQITNDDLLVVNGTDIRNATYVPYGNPTDSELIINDGRVRGFGYMERLSDLREYEAPIYDPGSNVTVSGGGKGVLVGNTNANVNYSESAKYFDKASQGLNTVYAELSKENNGMGKEIVAMLNRAIKSKGSTTRYINAESPDSSTEGTYVYDNLLNQYYTNISNYYEDKYTPSILNKSINSDYFADARYSAKQLSGIYGFSYEKFFGENSYTIRYENAGSYQSFATRFWDAGVGGRGGNIMEIARRFFPSQDRSRVDYNPLKNNMPDWLPDYLQVGNPFSKLTKAEMRLPGKGYESLNELHPDEYDTDGSGYGAFDRFKILADVAPNSKEYKIWHNIVKHQIKDPNLRKEMEDIEARTKRMRGSHEFYEYQYLHTNTHYETDIVKSVLEDGRILLANNRILTLAGIQLNENYNNELQDIFKAGDKITYRTEEPTYDDEKGTVVRNAAVFKGGGESINKRLVDMGVATRDKSDTSAIGQLATVSGTQEVLGMAQELIAHARIPILHNKFLHIETAREAFESEQINGANFQTWDHPIETIIKPMINETMRMGLIRRVAATAYSDFHFNKVLTSTRSGLTKKASGALLATLDPMAMMAGTTNWVLRLNNGRVGNGKQVLGAWSKGAKFGSTAGTVMWGIANADNPAMAATSFALAGADLFKKLELDDYALKKFGKHLDLKGAAAIGAGIGLGVSALKNSYFDKNKMFGKWQPKKYKKINELNEYFDRLEYIKYKGLYEAAARKAALFEKANLKDTFKQIDKNKARIAELQKKGRKLLEKYGEQDPRYLARIEKINEEINAIKERGNNMFVGGKYTKSAVAYKKAMESTIYGLGPGATKDEILAAVPDQYKDYFQSFMDEKDPEERKKILKMLPDYLKRPLQAAWGEELSEVDSNRKYFKSHKLPGMNWRGWKPNINLKHVKMKTVENEGMILSDFGFYESEKAKAAYEMAPDIENYDQRSFGLSMSFRLAAELRGLGISTSNVSLEQTSTPGFWMTADIKQSIEDRMEVGSNSLGNAISSITANFL